MQKIITAFCLAASALQAGGFKSSEKLISRTEIHTIAVVPYGASVGDLSGAGAIWIDPNLDLPGSRVALSERLAPYASRSLTVGDLQNLEETIAEFYKQHSRPVVSVVIPPQDLASGVLQVAIIEAVVEDITLTGNKWTASNWIQKSSGIKLQQPLNSYKMQRGVAWLNRSPFRRTDVVLSKGERTGTTKAELVTQERFPLKVYGGGDNTGTSFLKHTRWFAGANAGNLWGVDHLASVQWTTAINHKTFLGLTGQYTAPLPWYHQLLFYGGYAWFKGDLPVPEMAQTGKNWQISGRYQIPIPPIFGNFLQEVSFGYDHKRTNNDLLFGGFSFQTGNADTNQFYLSYMLDYKTQSCATSLRSELFAAPWKLSHDQSLVAYERLRPGSKPEYAYGRVRLSHMHDLPLGFSVKGVAAGQITSWNLLPSEQFGLGGYDTVRGYEERGFNADQGVMASVEVLSPKIRFTKKHDALEFLGFIDYGWGRLHKAFFGQKRTDWLLGVGPGMRYRFKTNVVIRCDVGFPLHKAGVGRHGIHYHIGGTISY